MGNNNISTSGSLLLNMYKMLLNQNQHIFGPVFQIGTVVEGTADFYSSRIPKRQRKTNMIDELLADAEFRRYFQLLNQ